MQLKGIYVPIVTPFNADESINYPVLEQLIEYLIANKIAGLVPGGTTGEVYAFTEASNLVLATGHAMLGLSLGPGTGLVVSQLLNGQEPAFSLSPMRLERFG